MADAGFFRGTTSEQDARFTDKQKKLIKSMKFQPSLAEKVDMEKVNLDVLKPWITKRVTELLSGIEDEVLIGYIFELLESSRHPDPKKMQIDITGFLNGKNARIFMGELWTHLHSAQVNIGGIPADFLEKKKEEIRQRKRETEIIQENLRKTLSVEADSTSMREHRHRSSKDTREWHSHTLPLPNLSTPDINQTPAMQEQLEIRKSLVGYMTSPASIPSGRDKPGWYGEHEKHVEIAKTSSAGVLLIGDSIIQGLARYPKVWNQYFAPLKSLNFGLGGDRTQNVLWRVENGEIPLNAQTIVIHVGTNNTDRDKPKDIANGIGSIAMMFQEAKPNAKIILTGLLPRDLQPSNRRKEISKVNKYLKLLCTSGHIRNFYYLKPDKDWVLPDGTLNTSYYFHDYLHLLEEGDEKFAKSIYNIITNIYSGIKIEMSSDSEISGDEGNTSYTFERQKGQPRSVSPDSRTHSSRPSRYRSRSRSPKRSRSRSPKRSRSRSRRRSRSRSVKRHSRSPQRKRYRKESSHGRSRRRSHSRSRSRHRSRSRSTSRTPPRKRTRRRSVSRSKSPSPPPRPVNNNLRELTKVQSPSPPPTHGRSNGNLVQLKNGETEREQRVCEESEEPVKIKPADEGLMKEDAESSTTFPRSDKLQSRTYRRRNSESDESADPEKIEPPLSAVPVITTQETKLKHKEESEEEKSPTPTRKASPNTKSSPHHRRRSSRSPRYLRRVPKKHSPSFTPSPPRRKPSPPRKRPERRHSPPRRKERRSPPRKKSPVKDSSSDRSTSPEVRKRRQLRKKREQEARGKAERERAERAERAERLERAEREKELRAKEAREKERKLAERLREKHRQRQRQKRSPSVSESESESDRETRRKKMVEAAAKRIAQASESDESEVDSDKQERMKQKCDIRNSKGEQKYNWKVKKEDSSDEAEEEDANDKTHRKRSEYQQVIERIKKEESSDERHKKEESPDERVKKAESSEDAESEVEEETHPVVETLNIRPKIEEYEYEEEFEEETPNPRSRKPTKSNNTPTDMNKNESSSDEEEPEKPGKKHRRDAEETYKKTRKRGSSAMKSPQKSSKRRQHSESIDESSDEDEVDKRRIMMKNLAHGRSISPSPETSKLKSRSTSPENVIEKRKFERKEESEPEEEEEEEEEEEVVHEEPKRIPRKADTSEEEEEEQVPVESEQEADTSPERERRRRKSSKKEKKHKRHKSKSKKKKSKKKKRYSDDENSEDEDSDVERQLRERALKSMRKKARHHQSDSSS